MTEFENIIVSREKRCSLNILAMNKCLMDFCGSMSRNLRQIRHFLLLAKLSQPIPCLTSLMVFSHQSKTRQRQDTCLEPVHSYYAFHTRSDMSGVKGIIGMHRFNICLVVVLLWCENTINLDLLHIGRTFLLPILPLKMQCGLSTGSTGTSPHCLSLP